MEEELFQVEKIIGKRLKKNTKQYLVKWQGYDISEATWENTENLIDCYDLIESFENNQKNQKSKKAKQEEFTINGYVKNVLEKGGLNQSTSKQKSKKNLLFVEDNQSNQKTKKLQNNLSNKQNQNFQALHSQRQIQKVEKQQNQNDFQNFNYQQNFLNEDICIQEIKFESGNVYLRIFDQKLNMEIGYLTYKQCVLQYPRTLCNFMLQYISSNQNCHQN